MARPKTVPDADVLHATAQALGELGPAGLTLAEVGDRCGLSAAAVQRRFGSKQGLLLALCAGAAPAWREGLAAADRAHPEDPLEAALSALCAPSLGLGGSLEAARHLATFADDLLDPERAPLVRAWYALLREDLAARLRGAVARGSLAKHDPEALAAALCAMWSGAMVELCLEAGSAPPDHARGRLELLLAPLRR
ncbi:MAG: TetR/AcrR family transcriptional regulator [Alphaproteobacteria bacterium]|nr:TetR/AcrR family transcriptional regulator [Alphaproteobacteria bacterium]